MITKQFTLYLKNKPGALARVTRLLAAGKINIEGISASSSVDIGLAQIVADNPTLTGKLLRKAGIPFVTQDVALVLMDNKPGALARILYRLARLGININYVYATACEVSGRCYTVISAPDLQRVEKACRLQR